MDARYNKIKEMRESGMTWKKIGLHFGVTDSRVGEIYRRQEFKSRYESYGLDTRTYDSLLRALYTTSLDFPEFGLPRLIAPDGNDLRDVLLKHLNSGKPLLLCRGFGNKTKACAEKFLGMKLEWFLTDKGLAVIKESK